MITRAEAIAYHTSDKPGKIEVRPTKICMTPRDLRLAYLPGASYACAEVTSDPNRAFSYTARGNLVGVFSDGSAVTGLGNIGPVASKPMLEGLAVLLKRLADIDVFDLEMSVTDPDKFVEVVQMLEPTFGAINLKDIKAPEGLYIYEQLRGKLSIPVIHENLHSTAVVMAAALLNSLELVEKQMNQIRIVACGAGTVGIGCARLLVALGVPPENILMYDVLGLLCRERDDLNEYQRPFACSDSRRRLVDGIKGADVFLGASVANVLTLEMIRSMNRFPIVFALATPEPEIEYERAKASRQDIIVTTGLGQHPNAVLDILSFPYVLRGALDVQATRITDGMLLAAARALASLAKEDVVEEVERAYGQRQFTFGPDYLLPKPIDPRILVWESSAVAQQAMEDRVARRPLESSTHLESLSVRIGTGRDTMRSLILRARQRPLRVVFSEGMSETILRACAIIVDEGIAEPIVLGSETRIREVANRISLDLGGITIIDNFRSPCFDKYAEEYFRRRWRHGVMRALASDRMRQRDYFGALMVHTGDADMMVAGFTTHYVDTLRTILEVIGPRPMSHRISSHHLVLLPKDTVLLADCTVNIDPTAEELAEIALQTASAARALGLEPSLAMLSFSNFGSVTHVHARKVSRALAIIRELSPDLVVDGEMQLITARDAELRHEHFPLSILERNANVLIFPDLQSANLTMHALQCMGDAVPIGPVLMGTRLPCHLLQYRASVQEVVNLTTVAVVEAATIDRHPNTTRPNM